jgi:hypothetical protein
MLIWRASFEGRKFCHRRNGNTKCSIFEMSQNPHQVFKSVEGYGRWDPYILQCDLIEGLTSDEKERTKRALLVLRSQESRRLAPRKRRPRRAATRCEEPFVWSVL